MSYVVLVTIANNNICRLYVSVYKVLFVNVILTTTNPQMLRMVSITTVMTVGLSTKLDTET